MFPSDTENKGIFDVVHRLAYVAEYRVPDTTSHIERIRKYCFLLSRELGLSIPEAEMIAHASMLHDVGKISLSDELVTKTGTLTASEWVHIKRHPTVGAELLQGSPSLVIQTAEIIAYTHHERWDGSGYPQGLQKENIPLSGRICAVADVFDALTTKRTYKIGITIEEAVQLISDSSGQLFDPRIVQVFRAKLNDVLHIRETTL